MEQAELERAFCFYTGQWGDAPLRNSGVLDTGNPIDPKNARIWRLTVT